MTRPSTLNIRFNAPLILGVTLVSLAMLVLDRLTRSEAIQRLFGQYITGKAYARFPLRKSGIGSCQTE